MSQARRRPRATPDASLAIEVRAPQVRLGMRVLIVEDSQLFRDALVDALRDEGHEPVEAIDGLDAWQQLQDFEPPDVILLDLMMPRMDGHTFRTRQLGRPALAPIPTLVLTAQPLEPPTRIALGEIPVIPKAFSIGSLLAAIDEVSQPPSPSKRCACGRSYDAIAWAELPRIGEIDNGREAGERMELRNCPCGSTIARELGRHAISWRPEP